MLDIIIVGGGPIGIACAIEAEKKRLFLSHFRKRKHCQ